jgi:hypothetical protein
LSGEARGHRAFRCGRNQLVGLGHEALEVELLLIGAWVIDVEGEQIANGGH